MCNSNLFICFDNKLECLKFYLLVCSKPKNVISTLHEVTPQSYNMNNKIPSEELT